MLICYRETTSHSPPNCQYGQKMVNHAGKQKSAWRILRNNVRKRRPWCFFFLTRTLLQWNVMLHRTMFLTKKCLLSTLLVRGVVRYAKLRGKRSSPFCKQAVRQTNLLRNDYIKMMLSQNTCLCHVLIRKTAVLKSQKKHLTSICPYFQDAEIFLTLNDILVQFTQ